jgi:hypothetical protein
LPEPLAAQRSLLEGEPTMMPVLMAASSRGTPAYGLTAWLETYASADYQSDAVSLTLLRRFGTAFDDLDTEHLLGCQPSQPTHRKSV